MLVNNERCLSLFPVSCAGKRILFPVSIQIKLIGGVQLQLLELSFGISNGGFGFRSNPVSCPLFMISRRITAAIGQHQNQERYNDQQIFFSHVSPPKRCQAPLQNY